MKRVKWIALSSAVWIRIACSCRVVIVSGVTLQIWRYRNLILFNFGCFNCIKYFSQKKRHSNCDSNASTFMIVNWVSIIYPFRNALICLEVAAQKFNRMRAKRTNVTDTLIRYGNKDILTYIWRVGNITDPFFSPSFKYPLMTRPFILRKSRMKSKNRIE